MSTLTAVPHIAEPAAGISRLPERLVIGGALIAPLNLLLVRSLTAYDVLIGCALLLVLRERSLVWPPRRYMAMAYVFMLAALLSAFRATYASEALTQVLQYAFIFFVQIPVVITVVRSRRQALTAVALLCVGTIGAITYAYLTQPIQGSGRVLVFYSENPNRLGYPAVYLVPLLVVLWHASRGKCRAVRAMTGIAVAASLYLGVWAVSASGSRSSMLGTLAALLVFAVLRPGHGTRWMLARFLLLCVVVGGLGFGLLATGQLPTTLEERINRSIHPEDNADLTHLVADRENLADAGVRAFVASPFLGTGLDNFRYVTTDYDLDATPQLPHNLWLQLLVQVGIFGTLAFGLYLLFWLVDLKAAYRRAHPGDAELLWGLVASLVGILTIFFFAPEMLDRHYWLIVALGLAVARISDAHVSEARRTRPRSTS